MFLNTLLVAPVDFIIIIYSFEHIDGPLNEERVIYFAPSVCCFFFTLPSTSWFLFFIFCDGRFVLWCAGFLLLFIIIVADLD